MKKASFIANFWFLLLTCLCFNNCKKNAEQPIDKLNIVLYDKPLSVIQQYIQGRWKLLYGKGGISANTVQYYNYDFWEFSENQVKIMNRGNIDANATIQWEYEKGTYTNGDYTFTMKFYDIEQVPWVYVVDRIYNDTLILHDNSSDAFFYHFIKSN